MTSPLIINWQGGGKVSDGKVSDDLAIGTPYGGGPARWRGSGVAVTPRRGEQRGGEDRWKIEMKWITVGPCACGCGKQARASAYHSDCANECRCGCGRRTRYAYAPGHRPEVACRRCSKVFCPNPELPDSDREICARCRRHVRDGGPLVMDTSLAFSRRMQKNAPEGRRWCSGCEQYRLLNFFGKDSTRVYSRCKPCHKAQLRAAGWKKRFGITPEQYEQIRDIQGGRCAICQTATGATKALAVDHNHEHCATGCPDCIRGLLCSTCNQFLGFGRDDPALFQRAVEYLLDPPSRVALKSPPAVKSKPAPGMAERLGLLDLEDADS